MGYVLKLVNNLPRMVAEGAAPTIYDQTITVVASGASGPNQINVADATTGSNITLPASGTYTDQELQVYFNGRRIDDVLDYNHVGVAPRTQIALTFNAEVGDLIRFYTDRTI